MEIFAISPASPKPVWFVVFICALLALIFAALAYTAYSARNSRVELLGDRIKLVGDFWGREIPLSLLNSSQARVLDLNQDAEYAPKRRTLGTGLPGYSSGWFRLGNGEKALVYLTQRNKVFYVPTSDGYSLLLSIDDPQQLVDRLQNRE